MSREPRSSQEFQSAVEDLRRANELARREHALQTLYKAKCLHCGAEAYGRSPHGPLTPEQNGVRACDNIEHTEACALLVAAERAAVGTRLR